MCPRSATRAIAACAPRRLTSRRIIPSVEISPAVHAVKMLGADAFLLVEDRLTLIESAVAAL